MDLIDRLSSVERFDFYSKSGLNSSMDWNFFGIGNVHKKYMGNKIYFDEKIILSNGMVVEDKKMWEIFENKLIFSRFRNKIYEKIFSFNFIDGEYILEKNYICELDSYSATIFIEENCVVFIINIKSNKKNEEIVYKYY